eukprot:12324718-Alexandrium_andersonii.AAC.1
MEHTGEATHRGEGTHLSGKEGRQQRDRLLACMQWINEGEREGLQARGTNALAPASGEKRGEAR